MIPKSSVENGNFQIMFLSINYSLQIITVVVNYLDNSILKAISEKYSNQLKTMIGTLNKMIEDQSALGDGFIVASFKGNFMHQVDCQKYGSAIYQVLKAHYNRHGYQTMYSCKVSGDVEGYCMINIRINFVEQ